MKYILILWIGANNAEEFNQIGPFETEKLCNDAITLIENETKEFAVKEFAILGCVKVEN